MEKRKIKQIIFGIVFIITIILIIAGIYFLLFRSGPSCFNNYQDQGETGIDCGGPCAPCEIKNAQSLEATQIGQLSGGPDKTVLVFQITNPNNLVGVGDFTYTLDIYDKSNNSKINSTFDHSFIYPSEVKYLIKVVDIDSSKIGKVNINFENLNWQLAGDFKEPDVVSKNFQTDIYNSQENTIPSADFTRDLFIGIKGSDVTDLQAYLKKQGFYNGSTSTSFTYALKSALIKYQKAKSLKPANGYFGGVTRNYMNTQIDSVRNSISSTADIYPITISGVAKNNDVVSASKSIVSGLIFSDSGTLIGASQTELDNINPAEEISFKLVFPNTINIQAVNQNLTKVYIDSIR